MSQPAIVTVKKLTSRLENATASERLDALQEFQTLARTEAKLIGEYALQRVLDFLKEQGSAEEYQESLDLIDRLIKTRDRQAAIANTGIILSSIENIALLLGAFISTLNISDKWTAIHDCLHLIILSFVNAIMKLIKLCSS